MFFFVRIWITFIIANNATTFVNEMWRFQFRAAISATRKYAGAYAYKYSEKVDKFAIISKRYDGDLVWVVVREAGLFKRLGAGGPLQSAPSLQPNIKSTKK